MVFACNRAGLADSLRGRILGGYDGSGSWRLSAMNLRGGEEQELVESHEGLHHELQSSTAYGLLASLSVQLAGRGVRRYALNEFFDTTVQHSIGVHETFATTLSSLVAGVDHARRMLANNPTYLGFLERGLALVPADLPDRFRNAGIAAVLRCCMAPAGTMALLERGFAAISRLDLEDPAWRPDTRLNRYRQAVEASGWRRVARDVAGKHPKLVTGSAGPVGDELADPVRLADEEMAQACYEHVRRVLDEIGLPSVAWDQQADVAVALKAAVEAVDGDLAARLNIVLERRPVLDDGLEYDRQKVVLRERLPVQLIRGVDPADMVPAFALPDGGAGSHVCAVWLARDVLAKQFEVSRQVELPDPVVAFMIAGVAEDGSPSVRLGLLDSAAAPGRVQESLGGAGLLVLTSHLTLSAESTDALLRRSTPVFVVMDLPVAWHVDEWIRQGATVRMGLVPLDGLETVELWLAVFAVDRRPGYRFLSIGGKVGVSLLVERLRRRHGARLVIDGELLRRDIAGLNLALNHIMAAWHVLDQDALQ
jgi:hypothetical protein